MEQETRETPLERRVRLGRIQRRDIQRRLGELAFGRANDCVRLVLEALSGMLGNEEGEMKAFLQALRGGEDGRRPFPPSKRS